MDDPLSREQALEFLEGMERRHNEVLESLNELNHRIETVLEQTLQKNNAAPASSEVADAKKAA